MFTEIKYMQLTFYQIERYQINLKEIIIIIISKEYF